MHDMEFRGSLPSMIGSLTALRALSLTRMFITGTIPTQIGLLTNLRMFSLVRVCPRMIAVSSFVSYYPSRICLHTFFCPMQFGSSGLRGSLPTEIGALSSLSMCCCTS